MRTCKRIVVKVGTSTLTHDDGRLRLHRMEMLCRALSDIKNGGREVILVSSGAVGAGVSKLGLPGRPNELRGKQAAAAVGQCRLMHLYDKFFGEYDHPVGQILLTADDVGRETSRHNLLNTFETLLDYGAIPIVNENDSVSAAEIAAGPKLFAENDMLSAVVALLVKADLLIMLSDVDGLYDGDPHKNPDARHIPLVKQVEDVLHLAGDAGTERGTGGTVTKLAAARMATAAGIEMVIASGEHPERLRGICEGDPIGTRFLA
jgi:glutamate 5-kinase